jgi:hypothetical protein
VRIEKALPDVKDISRTEAGAAVRAGSSGIGGFDVGEESLLIQGCLFP